MEWFHNLKIGPKMQLGFLLVTLIAVAIGITGIVNLNDVNNRDTFLYEKATKPLAQLARLSTAFEKMRNDCSMMLSSTSRAETDGLAGGINQQDSIIQSKLTQYRLSFINEQDRLNFNNLAKIYHNYYSDLNNYSQLLHSGDKRGAANYHDGAMKASESALVAQVDMMIQSNEAAAQQTSDSNTSTTVRAESLMSGLLIVGALVAVLVGLWITKQIRDPLRKTTAMLQEMGNGHLSGRLKLNTKDEVGVMAATMDQFADDLQKYVVGSMKRISEGDFDFEIPLKDESDEIAPALNGTTKTLEALKAETDKLIKYSVEGRLSERGKADNFKGGYREIVVGINDILDAVILPIQEGSDVLKVMAKGDLTARVKGEYKGDHQIIKKSINQLGESLSKVISEVTEAVQSTASASAQISSSTEEMAAGAQEQSAQSGEVATAVEEMTKTIVETTRNAGVAADTAKNAGRKAEEGGNVVKSTIVGMDKVAEVVGKSADKIRTLGNSSNQIGEIVQVIDDIADQTNLLALNAAIEAARAGEQGRGFAVVADEVRKLAERTTKATKEIADMIKKIQSETSEVVASIDEGTAEVENGKKMADQASIALQEIIGGAQQVVDIISQVAAASEEQSSAAEQISKNIESINSVSQQSAAGTQQIAKAADDLNRLTTNLHDLISRFKIDVGEKPYDRDSSSREKGSIAVRSNGHLVEA